MPLAHDERGDGPPLVLLHGHPFSRALWTPQLDDLGADFRVIAVDLPGYGASPARGPVTTMAALADAVLATFDALQVGDALVVGLSMGGLVAMELGLGHPGRVRGLVLTATTAEPVAEGEPEERERLARTAETFGMLPLAGAMITTLFGPEAGRDHDLVRRIFAMMLASPPEGAAAALRGRARRPDYATLLRGLTVPALVITGDHDPHAPEAVVTRLVDALPEPRLMRFAASGHLPNLEEPARFNAAVRAFARDIG